MRVFQKFGYEQVRQHGSHIRLRHPNAQRAPLTVPDHRELKPGLLRALMRDAGITVQDFVDALD